MNPNHIVFCLLFALLLFTGILALVGPADSARVASGCCIVNSVEPRWNNLPPASRAERFARVFGG